MPLAALPPALPALELSFAPVLVSLSVFGAGLALVAWRAGLATLGRAALGACAPAALWLLLAALQPSHPTRLVVTPLGAGLALSFCCGLLSARSAARRAGCSLSRSIDCYLWSCAAALASAGLFHALGQVAGGSHPFAAQPASGVGLSASGAVLGALAGVWWCFREQPRRGRAWLDAFGPTLGLALALGWAGAYLQQPTHTIALCVSGVGLALAMLALAVNTWQRFHGLSFVVAAFGYGIVQVSIARLDSARAITHDATPVASWLVIALAIVAGWFWRKDFTWRGI